MEMCITGYGVMDNSVCSIWKSKVVLVYKSGQDENEILKKATAIFAKEQ